MISHSRWRKIRKPVISLFVIFHLTLILVWLFLYCFAMRPSDLTALSPLRNYILFLGIDQDWRVFAPKPRDTNLHLVAVVTRQDGTLELWEYPRMERMNFVDRLYRERFRKYAHDNVAWGGFESFLPDLALYIARLNNNPGNPPVRVSLVRYSAPIPVPTAGVNHDFPEALPPQSDTETITTYAVKPGDLE